MPMRRMEDDDGNPLSNHRLGQLAALRMELVVAAGWPPEDFDTAFAAVMDWRDGREDDWRPREPIERWLDD